MKKRTKKLLFEFLAADPAHANQNQFAGEIIVPWVVHIAAFGRLMAAKWWAKAHPTGTVVFKRVVHPGEILREELAELGLTATEFARQIEVPANRVSQIIAGKRAITGDTALRFGHWFGTDPQFWLNLQTQYDLALADREVGGAVRRLPTRSNLPVTV